MWLTLCIIEPPMMVFQEEDPAPPEMARERTTCKSMLCRGPKRERERSRSPGERTNNRFSAYTFGCGVHLWATHTAVPLGDSATRLFGDSALATYYTLLGFLAGKAIPSAQRRVNAFLVGGGQIAPLLA